MPDLLERVFVLFDIGGIISEPGLRLAFKSEFDFSDMEFNGMYPACEPARMTGTISNKAGALVLEGTIETVLHVICDRCTKPLEVPYHVDAEAVFAYELTDEASEDQIFLLTQNCADLEEVARTLFVLNMDVKYLCSEDCHGLCPTCGKDLNEGDCNCEAEIDPRLAALKQFFKDKD